MVHHESRVTDISLAVISNSWFLTDITSLESGITVKSIVLSVLDVELKVREFIDTLPDEYIIVPAALSL